MYTFVREDLKDIHKLVQTGHSLHEAGASFGSPPGCHLITLSVKNEEELLEVVKILENSGISHICFYEPHKFSGGPGYTSIATEPLRKENTKIFRQWKLLKI